MNFCVNANYLERIAPYVADQQIFSREEYDGFHTRARELRVYVASFEERKVTCAYDHLKLQSLSQRISDYSPFHITFSSSAVNWNDTNGIFYGRGDEFWRKAKQLRLYASGLVSGPEADSIRRTGRFSSDMFGFAFNTLIYPGIHSVLLRAKLGQGGGVKRLKEKKQHLRDQLVQSGFVSGTRSWPITQDFIDEYTLRPDHSSLRVSSLGSDSSIDTLYLKATSFGDVISAIQTIESVGQEIGWRPRK